MQVKWEVEVKVRGRMLAEAVVAEVRWAAKQVNDQVRDLAWKVNDELWKSQSPVKGKHHLVSCSGFLVAVELKLSIG